MRYVYHAYNNLSNLDTAYTTLSRFHKVGLLPLHFLDMGYRLIPQGGSRGGARVWTFIVASDEMHSIDFYCGSRTKKNSRGGGGAIRNPKKSRYRFL